jgi:tryptophanyl-tRNA synthetase
VKAEAAEAGLTTISGLLLTYPVHQAADILFCHANLVPVGRDQLPHVEQTRHVARRFNERYGGGDVVLPEPQALLSAAPVLLGADGRKMSKSRGNAVALGASEDETARLIRRFLTDSERQITYEPERRPEIASLLLIAGMCTGRDPDDVALSIGDRGAAALKGLVTEAVNEHLRPLRQRRRELARDCGLVHRVLAAGNQHANEIAVETLASVQRALGMQY